MRAPCLALLLTLASAAGLSPAAARSPVITPMDLTQAFWTNPDVDASPTLVDMMEAGLRRNVMIAPLNLSPLCFCGEPFTVKSITEEPGSGETETRLRVLQDLSGFEQTVVVQWRATSFGWRITEIEGPDQAKLSELVAYGPESWQLPTDDPLPPAEEHARSLFQAYIDGAEMGMDPVPFETQLSAPLRQAVAAKIKAEAEMDVAWFPATDPLCNCTDLMPEGLSVTKLQSAAAGHAIVAVRFTSGGTAHEVELDLISEPAGWRVDNVTRRDPAWSLRGELGL